MSKIKLTKNELKNQRDALKRFERYLPTLQLKKQQLQLEVRQNREAVTAISQEMDDLVKVTAWHVGSRNVAGIDVPVFESIDIETPEYDLFSTPVWFDDAVQLIRQKVELGLRKKLSEETQQLLEQELRVVTQRVNLFEKVMIPEARENIRVINIYLGDQQTNSVGRSKIAKGKCAARDASIA